MKRSQLTARRRWQLRLAQRRRVLAAQAELPAASGESSTWRKMLAYACAAAGLALALSATGCNRFFVYQHHHTSYDFTGEPHVTYYHYPAGSWFVPAHQTHKHCPQFVEPPFHGFASTCWNRWPEPWEPCPPPGMCPAPLLGEEIMTPPPEMIDQAQPALEPTPATPTYESSRRPHQKQAAAAQRAAKQPPVASSEALMLEPVTLVGAHGFSQPQDTDSSAAVIDLAPLEPKQSGFSK